MRKDLPVIEPIGDRVTLAGGLAFIFTKLGTHQTVAQMTLLGFTQPRSVHVVGQ